MAKYIIAALVMTVFLIGHPAAGSDSVVVEDGDVRINGFGNGLVFWDGSKQQSAVSASLVIQHVSSPSGVSFPNGQQSPSIQTCVQCPSGMVALGGGGVQTAGGVGFVLINGSFPTLDSSSWCVRWVASLQSPQSQDNNVETHATCVRTAL